MIAKVEYHIPKAGRTFIPMIYKDTVRMMKKKFKKEYTTGKVIVLIEEYGISLTSHDEKVIEDWKKNYAKHEKKKFTNKLLKLMKIDSPIKVKLVIEE